MNIKNNLRRAWQWFWGNTYIAIKLWLIGWSNNRMYRKACENADILSQRLNWQRVYLFPNPPDKGPGIRLVTSAMIAEENKHRSKKQKLEVRALLTYSYGWADKNTSALENFYHGKKKYVRKAEKVAKKARKLREMPVRTEKHK